MARSKDYSEHAASIPLLKELSDEDLQATLELAELRSFEPDEVIVRQGVLTQDIWILVEGRCDVVKDVDPGEYGEPVVLSELTPFEQFGEMSFFDANPHSGSVWARTDVKLLKIRRRDFDQLAESRPRLAYRLAVNVVTSLSNRLRHMDQWVAELVNKSNPGPMVQQWQELRERLQSRFKGYLV